MLALFLAACRAPVPDDGPSVAPPEPFCLAGAPEGDTLPGSTQTYDVAVDPIRRRAVATGLGLPWLSVIDLDARAKIDAIAWAEAGNGFPQAAFDGEGIAWVAGGEPPYLVRMDLDARTTAEVDGMEAVSWVLGRPDGGAIAGGPRAAGLYRAPADGSEAAFEAGAAALAAAWHPDGLALFGQDGARIVDPDSGELVRACALPFVPVAGASLADGTLIAASLTRIARTSCFGEAPPEAWDVGVDIKEVVTDGTTAWALDRVSAEDPTHGVAWAIGAAGEPIAAFATAKNTGFGAIDGDTLWANSEGTSTIDAWSLPAGEPLAAIPTAWNVDAFAPMPDGGFALVGRLSDLMVRYDAHGARLARVERAPRWPWAPTVGADGDLWVLAQLDGAALLLDPDTLAVRETVDLDAPWGDLITFGDLAWSAHRESLLVAESATDALIEIRQGEDGLWAVASRWSLDGPPVSDDYTSQLEVVTDGDVAWLTRTWDGRVQRLDLATGELTTAFLAESELRALQGLRRTRALFRAADGRLWLGPYPIDPDTLAVGEILVGVAAVLAPWPGGGFVAEDASGLDLLRLTDAGEIAGSAPIFDEPQPGLEAWVDVDRRWVWTTRSYEGEVCPVPMRDITDTP